MLLIVEMGQAAVPFIIEEIRKSPDLLVGILSTITKIDIVRGEDRGDLSAISAAWIEWFNKTQQ